MSRKQLTEHEMDALIVRSLARLPAFGPGRGFGERVMTRVRLPQPRPLALYGRARSWVAEPRHALALAAVYAVAASVALVVAVPWLVRHSPALGFAYDWSVARTLGLVREVSMAVAGWVVSSGLAARARGLALTGTQIWVTAFTVTAGYAGCAFGLHHLLRAPRGNDATVHVEA